jgi:hypothetical protein
MRFKRYEKKIKKIIELKTQIKNYIQVFGINI